MEDRAFVGQLAFGGNHVSRRRIDFVRDKVQLLAERLHDPRAGADTPIEVRDLIAQIVRGVAKKTGLPLEVLAFAAHALELVALFAQLLLRRLLLLLSRLRYDLAEGPSDEACEHDNPKRSTAYAWERQLQVPRRACHELARRPG